MNASLPQTASTSVAYSDLISQQTQTLQNAQSSLPALPPQLAGTLSGIISGLNSGVSQAEAVSMTAGLIPLLFLAVLQLAVSLETPSFFMMIAGRHPERDHLAGSRAASRKQKL